MKLTKHFILQEFIDPETWRLMGEKSVGLIDERIVDAAELFRRYFDVPVIINNWHVGGGFKESGLRRFETKTGAAYSQHKFGRAVDMKLENLDAEAVRQEVIRKWNIFKNYGITAMENDTPTWVHIDCRYTGSSELLLLPYKR